MYDNRQNCEVDGCILLCHPLFRYCIAHFGPRCLILKCTFLRPVNGHFCDQHLKDISTFYQDRDCVFLYSKVVSFLEVQKIALRNLPSN